MSSQTCEGILEIMPEGHGFLRNPRNNFRASKSDIFVPPPMIRHNQLLDGLLIAGKMGKPPGQGKASPLKEISSINGKTLEQYHERTSLKESISIDPEERLRMTRGEKDLTGMAIDILTPVGKGQRGMIISPPKAGKTTILKHIAKAVRENNPEVEILVLLVDERPEEVTDFQRDLDGTMVFHSSSDQEVENHLRIISLTMNMAMRIAELGGDVLVLMDSLTRMGRSYNKDSHSGGKTLSGGLAANALELPRRFFGAARNIEDGGSLTIMATILVDTGSRMDEVIFQEFKGTGNLDLVLSRECADRRIYPAINPKESGTRKEHKLYDEDEMDLSGIIRRKTANMKAAEAMPYVIDFVKEMARKSIKVR